MRVRHWRLLLALTNLCVAVLLVGVAIWAFVLEPSAVRRPIPHPPRPFILPAGVVPDDEPIEVPLHAAGGLAEPVGPSEAEDLRALADPQREFEAAWRVLFVALDPRDRTAHGCIVSSRPLGEQVYLVPGQRLADSYVLLGIDPVPGSPRGARLRFSDLRRGVVVEIALSPAP